METPVKQKVVIVGAGPVGCLAALYAAARGDDVELYELRGGQFSPFFTILHPFQPDTTASHTIWCRPTKA